MTKELLCEVRGLSVAYHRRGVRLPVLRDVSFEVGAGEAVALVGESGCGKTTIALTLMGYLPRRGKVEAGSVLLDGESLLDLDRRSLREVRGKKLTMVYQEPAASLNPTMKAGDQVAEVYRVHEGLGKKAAMDRACVMFEQVALPNPKRIAQSYPHQLSGGQQQRVVIAMALAANPRLVILDEPTTGLDATVQAEVLELIADLRENMGTAMLLISHNLPLVAQMCDRVVVLYAGRVVEQATSEVVFSEPRHPYTQGLLKCVPRFGASKRTRRLVPIEGSLPQLEALPPACVYQPRCERATESCTEREPELLALGATLVRCYHPLSHPEKCREVVEDARPSELARTAPSSEPLVSLRRLTKRFGETVACDAIDLDIYKGEILGVVGESGSGKSTLARCLVGLTQADAGEMLVNERPVPLAVRKRDANLRRRMQMVFQNPDTTLNPRHSTGYILRRAVRKLRGRKAAPDKIAQDLASAVKLSSTQLSYRGPQLSGGQRQRVAIARAFAGEPDLVVCDEPASALDVSVQATILNLLVDLQERRGVSIVFISHDLAVVRYVSDRIAVMYLGEIVEIGLAQDVFLPPHHPYTEALLSAIPRMDDRSVTRVKLAKETDDPSTPSIGCRFYQHCVRRIGGLCDVVSPPWQDLGGGHLTLCHLSPGELDASHSSVQRRSIPPHVGEIRDLRGELDGPGSGRGSRPPIVET